MPLDAFSPELDPYSSQVVNAFDRVGPAVFMSPRSARMGVPPVRGRG